MPPRRGEKRGKYKKRRTDNQVRRLLASYDTLPPRARRAWLKQHDVTTSQIWHWRHRTEKRGPLALDIETHEPEPTPQDFFDIDFL